MYVGCLSSGNDKKAVNDSALGKIGLKSIIKGQSCHFI